MIRTETAKRYGGTTVIPLTGFVEINKKYIVQDAEINGEKCIIIKEDKGVNVKLEEVKSTP